MTKKIMPPLKDLYMKWDEKGGYWYTPNGTQITPREMLVYASQLEAELTKEIESRDGWRDAWKKGEAENERLRTMLAAYRDTG